MDECVGPGLALWLADLNHDVVSIQLETPGIADPLVLQRSVTEERILITCDKDYCSLVFEHGMPHVGVVLLRLANDTQDAKITAMRDVLEEYSDNLEGLFVVNNGQRIRRTEPDNI